MRTKMQKLIKVIFFTYFMALFVMVIVKFKGSFYQMEMTRNEILWNRQQGYWNYNLTPFRTISLYLKNIKDSYAYQNILGNIVPFIPFGFFLPIAFLKKRRLLKTILISLLCVLVFEILQFISLLGCFDIDDIILDTLGCIVGYFIYFILNEIYAKKMKL